MPWVPLDDKGERVLYSWDLDLNGGKRGPRAAPGTYKVRLKAHDQTLSEELVVLKDPKSTGTLSDIEEQVTFSLKLRHLINQTTDMINNIEWMRKDLQELRKTELDKQLGEKVNYLEMQLIEIEKVLYDINLTGAREDAFRNPMKLYGRLLALANDVGTSSSDFKPTEQQLEVGAILEGRLQVQSEKYREVLKKEIPAVNALLKKAKVNIQIGEQNKTKGA